MSSSSDDSDAGPEADSDLTASDEDVGRATDSERGSDGERGDDEGTPAATDVKGESVDESARDASAEGKDGEGEGDGENAGGEGGEAKGEGDSKGEGKGDEKADSKRATTPKRKPPPSENEAIIRIQCMVRKRLALKSLRDNIIEQYRKVWDKSSQTYYYRDARDRHYVDTACFWYKDPALHARDSWDKPPLMGSDDLPSPRFIINTGAPEGTVGAGIAGELPYEQYTKLQYADVVKLRHDYIYDTELTDGVKVVVPPPVPRSVLQGRRHVCPRCLRFDMYDSTRMVCLHCRLRGRQPTLKELDLAGGAGTDEEGSDSEGGGEQARKKRGAERRWEEGGEARLQWMGHRQGG